MSTVTRQLASRPLRRMITMTVLAIIAPAMSAMADPQSGVVQTAADLQQMCRASDITPRIICAAYIKGVVSTLNAFVGSGAVKALVCTAAQLSTGAEMQIFDRYTQVHPQELHLEAEVVLISSLMQAFPCPR